MLFVVRDRASPSTSGLGPCMADTADAHDACAMASPSCPRAFNHSPWRDKVDLFSEV